MRKALTIAGSDCSGGAGIQADLKTFCAHGVYGMSVITAITCQNTTGVFAVHDVPADIVAGQLDAVFEDIRPDAVKIGMVSSVEIIEVIAQKLKQYRPAYVVLDPVMVATSGSKLLASDAVEALMTKLIPLAHLVTPNIPEAELLSGNSIADKSGMEQAAQAILPLCGGGVLVKGGHLDGHGDDFLCQTGQSRWYPTTPIQTENTHGTGCTLSAAIAARLALGDDMQDAVHHAKQYVTEALADGLDLGKGSGPLNHCYRLQQI